MGSTGISLDGAIFALFILALTAIGSLVVIYGSNIIKAIGTLSKKLDEHIQEDSNRFSNHSQRLTKIDGNIE